MVTYCWCSSYCFFFASRRRHTRCALVTGVQTCALPISEIQSLLLDCEGDPEALAPAGLRFVDVESVGCTQRSRPEAERLDRTYRALLGQKWRDKKGKERVIGVDDILVVSPYTMQVELLKRTLPAGARVGTVDKFQGQEAPVVLRSEEHTSELQ